MKIRTFAAALLAMAALSMPASSPAQHRRAAVAQRDWSLVAMRTPEGGVRIGNPAAPMKLIEYGSISCPHCAAFSGEAAAALRTRYVRTGRASWEYRPYLIFPTDPGLFMLLSCLAPARFFPATEELYATQSQWFGRVQALPADQLQTIQSMEPLAAARALVGATGLDPFFRARGLTPVQINACLANRAGIDRLAAISRHANELGVRGTPTFLLNGRVIGTVGWARLEPMLAGR
jgi:protein-disulfide isomerase